MSLRSLVFIALSILLSYIALIALPFVWMAIPAALPFLALKNWKNVFVGFGIGSLSAASIYLIYPLSNISSLAGILGSISGVPGPLTLALFPLLYGVVFALSALFWSGIDSEELRKRMGVG